MCKEMVKFNARLEGHIIYRGPMPELHEQEQGCPQTDGKAWDQVEMEVSATVRGSWSQVHNWIC